MTGDTGYVTSLSTTENRVSHPKTIKDIWCQIKELDVSKNVMSSFLSSYYIFMLQSLELGKNIKLLVQNIVTLCNIVCNRAVQHGLSDVVMTIKACSKQYLCFQTKRIQWP